MTRIGNIFGISFAQSGTQAKGPEGFKDSWTHWWLLPLTARADCELIDGLPIAPEGGGAGRIFHNHPSVRRTRTRILITQFGGYDC